MMSNQPEKPEVESVWYNNKIVVVVLLLIFFPVGLYALWKSQKFSGKTKWIVSGIFGVLMVVSLIEDSDVAPENENPTTKGSVPQNRAITSSSEAQIVFDEFNVQADIKDFTLSFSIDTDLPESTVVLVSVSRSYLEVGNTSTYSVEYFSEQMMVDGLRSGKVASVSDDDWTMALRAKQEEMANIGLGFDVAAIDDKITVRTRLPVNQFGSRNSNLVGKAVKIMGKYHRVEDEAEMYLPMKNSPMGDSPFLNIDPMNLEVGQSYVVARETPLCPSPNPADPMVAMKQIKRVPAGSGFRVLEVYRGKSSPWYQTQVFDRNGTLLGQGWINSIALIGQQLKAYK